MAKMQGLGANELSSSILFAYPFLVPVRLPIPKEVLATSTDRS